MLTSFLRTLCCFSFCVSASATSFHDDEAMPDKVLDYLVYSDHNAPYQFSDVEFGHKGIVCRIVDVIAARAGSVVHPHMEPIKRLKRSIETRKYQRWITYGMRSWAPTEAWKKHHFSDLDIFQFNPVLVQPANAETPINALVDIAHRRVLIINGFDYGPTYDFLLARGADIETVDTQQIAISMLNQGRADVFLEDEFRVRFTLSSMKLRAENFNMVSIRPASDQGLGVALVMSQDMPEENVKIMNQVLREMTESGELKDLIGQYVATVPNED